MPAPQDGPALQPHAPGTYPPGPTNRIPFAQARALRNDPIGFLTTLARYGDLSHFRMGPQHVYLANEPELIREVLVTQHRSFTKGLALQRAKELLGEGLLTSEGEVHLRQRRLMQPAFHRTRISNYARVMVDRTVRRADRWHDAQPLNVHSEMMQITLDIVAKTLFDTEIDGESDEIGSALTTLLELFDLLTSPLAPLLRLFAFRRMRRLEEAKAQLNRVVSAIIRERRAAADDRGDLLSMLLLSHDPESGGGMSDQQVRDEAMTLFLAGHETTANAVAWTLYLLATHPEVESELHREVDSVLGRRAAGAGDVAHLQFVERVVAESMRLYPPAWVVGRRAVEPLRLGGYLIPPGALVLASQFLMHHDQRYFPDPWRFDPGRWTPEAKAARQKFSYFPFGGGPRQCIGESFAWMEATLILATIAQRWSFTRRREEAVEMQPLITLRPRGGIELIAHRRPV